MTGPRILFLLQHHPADVSGGAEMQAWMLAREFVKRGWDTHYASERAAPPSSAVQDGVELHSLPVEYSPWNGNRTAIRALLRQLNPRVLYTRVFNPTSGWAIAEAPPETLSIWAAASRNDGKPWPYLAQGWRLHSPFEFIRKAPLHLRWNAISRKARHGAKLVLAQLNDQRADFLKLGIEAHVVRNSLPIPPEAELQTHEGVPMFLWADTIKSLKRPEIFLKLAVCCKDLPAKFCMIGRVIDAEYQGMIDQTARRAPNFRYEGFVPQSQVDTYFREAHVHVKTSLPIEGMPNTFIQSWSHGVPVASLQVDSDRMIQVQAVGTFAHTPDELERDVRKLAADRELRRKLGANARAFAIREFDLERNVDTLEMLIRERL